MVNKLDMKALVEDFSEGFIPVEGANVDQILKLNINSVAGQKFKKSKSLDYLNRTSAARSLMKTTKVDSLGSTYDTTRNHGLTINSAEN